MSFTQSNLEWLASIGMNSLVDSIQNGDKNSIEHDVSERNIFLSQFMSPRKVTYQRLSNLPKQYLSPVNISDQIKDVHYPLIKDQSPYLAENKDILPIPKDFILLSSVNFIYFNDLSDEFLASIRSLVVVESSYDSLAFAFEHFSFSSLVSRLKKFGVGLELIIDSSQETLSEKLFYFISERQPLSLSCLGLVRPKKLSSELLYVENQLFDSAKFAERFISSLGSTDDDLNHLWQASINLTASKRQLAIGKIDHSSTIPAVVTGSGPSLDKNIQHIKALNGKAHIFAAGSSVSSLLHAGIIPDALVLLERSFGLYESVVDLGNKFPKLREVTLIASLSVDPRLIHYFKNVIYYSRPYLSFSHVFSLESINLAIAGPESINAAVDAVIKLGYKNISLFGCDFGAEDTSSYRAEYAFDWTERSLDQPIKGNHNKTMFSQPSLIYACESMKYLLNYYLPGSDFVIKRYGVGLPLESPNLVEVPYVESNSMASLDSLTYDFAEIASSSLEKLRPNGNPYSLLSDLKSSVKEYFDNLIGILTDLDSSSIDVHRILHPYLANLDSDSNRSLYARALTNIARDTVYTYLVRWLDLANLESSSSLNSSSSEEISFALNRLSDILCLVLEKISEESHLNESELLNA